MRILVFGGSPKGETSVTMQYVKWLQQNTPGHTIDVVQVAQPIRRLEQDADAMIQIGEQVRAADGILWAFPLYIAMPHAGLKRFVELIREREIVGAFHGKHCAILTTSIHFYDHTAIEYMRGVSEDMGMMVDEMFSAEMQDLLRLGGTQQLEQFFHKWMGCIERGISSGRRTAPVDYTAIAYTPGAEIAPVHPIKVGIVTQSGVSANLDHMVSRIAGQFKETVIYDLSTMQIAGNCTGCLRCGYENICMYEGKDEVIDAWRGLRECDAVLFCGFIVDRYLSARWKTFIDRMFFNTHMPMFPGMPMGFVISGPLRQLPNLREVLEGVYGTMQVRLAGFATEEAGDIDSGIAALADSLSALAESGYTAPEQFPALCGRKVFRDEVMGGLCGIFPADHRYYKKHGWYDYPQKQIGARMGGFFMRSIMRIPAVRKTIQGSMKQNMIMAYSKIVDQGTD
ncbi:MAG: NAD(P)H-dependent oxidoreductase [Oscillospiraceae bacterium]